MRANKAKVLTRTDSLSRESILLPLFTRQLFLSPCKILQMGRLSGIVQKYPNTSRYMPDLSGLCIVVDIPHCLRKYDVRLSQDLDGEASYLPRSVADPLLNNCKVRYIVMNDVRGQLECTIEVSLQENKTV